MHENALEKSRIFRTSDPREYCSFSKTRHLTSVRSRVQDAVSAYFLNIFTEKIESGYDLKTRMSDFRKLYFPFLCFYSAVRLYLPICLKSVRFMMP